MATAKQIKTIHALLALVAKQRSRAITTEDRREMVYSFTGQRTASTKEINDAEAAEIIKHLQTMTGQKNTLPGEKMRRHIIAMAYEMRWKKQDGKIDMERVNNWCVRMGYLKKPLNAYTHEELPKLVNQFKMLLSWYLKRV